jgi:hypothetical protein
VSPAQKVTIATAVLVPVVTAILGVLGVMFQDWRARRTRAGKRKLALEDARRQVSFAVEWWNARQLLTGSTEAVQQATTCTMTWLEQAAARVTASEPPVAEDKTRITFGRILLFYRLQGTAANIIRGSFYVLLGLLVVYFGQMISDLLESRPSYVLGDLVIMIVISLVALSLRFWAVSAQNPTRKRRRIRWMTIRRALLLYRLGRPAASLVRIIFYAWAVILGLTFGAQIITDIGEKSNVLPNDAAEFIVVAGFAIGFRYWSASLGAAREDGSASDEFSLNIDTHTTDSSTQPYWRPTLDRQPDRNEL